MSENGYPCEMIQDLLPLYQDGICSTTSQEIVRAHLKTCGECQKIEEKLKNQEIDETLTKEKSSILKSHEKQEKIRTFTVGTVTACILLVPVAVCLICNLVIGHALDWFYIVLASMLMVASITVVPLMVPCKKGLWTIIGFTASLLVLLGVCCIYTGGSWFFVAAVSCIFGLSVFLAPYIVRQLPLPNRAAFHKGLIVIIWDTFWLYLLIVTCGIFVGGDSFYWRLSLSLTFYCLLFPWTIFLVVRYLKINAYTKTGIVLIVVGIMAAFANDVISLVSGIPTENSIFDADIRAGFQTTDWQTFSANIMLLAFAVFIVAGVIFLVAGRYCHEKHKD